MLFRYFAPIRVRASPLEAHMSRLPDTAPECAFDTASVATGPSRRAFLKLGAAAAGTLAVTAAPDHTLAQMPAAVPAQPPLRPLTAGRLQRNIAGVNDAAQPSYLIDPSDDWDSWTLRLARRVTMGLTDEEAQRARRLGYGAYLDYHLNYEAIDDAAAAAFVAKAYPALVMSGTELAASTDQAQQYRQLQEATIFRAAFSKRQLYDRMVELWTDHFTISINKVGYLKLIDDRDVIRTHALGKFPALLKASAKSAAMLAYLDQTTSRRGAPNQNYARELLELHTLGVDNGYTQTDVAELSRVLTGWTIRGRGEFYFNPTLHDNGPKTVLGKTFPAGPTNDPNGMAEGEAVLDLLAQHPNTATFIAKKVLSWLLWYQPTDAMIAQVAGVYTQTGGDIKQMVKASLSFDYLQQAPAKLKRPFHFAISALRAVNPTVTGVAAVNRQLSSLGQPLFAWETPDGYPDQIEYWAGNILPRWNYATFVAAGSGNELVVDTPRLVALGTAEKVTSEISRMAFGGELSDRTRAELLAYLKGGTLNAGRVREAFALALSSSSFQWY